MSGDGQPTDFTECLSQDQLQSVVDQANKDVKETVIQAVTHAILELKVANHLERLDRRISDLTDRVATLEFVLLLTTMQIAATMMILRCMMPTEILIIRRHCKTNSDVVLKETLEVWVGNTTTTTTIEVTVIELPMTLMLRLSLLYLLLMDIMMLRPILIGR
jgi:hypothetical protein